MFSDRSDFGRELNARARALEQARAHGIPLCDLTESNPTRAGIPYDRERIVRALGQPELLVYEPEPFGMRAARAAVARQLGPGAVDPAQILLTASTSEAYALLFKLLCNAGDEVLVPRPSYPLFEQLANLEHVRLVPYRLEYDGAWYVDMSSLRAGLGPRTRAIIIVSPNNPTGTFVKRSELTALASFGLPILSDEVFSAYAWDPSAAPVSASEAQGVLTFSMGGLSKLAALPQLKLAWTRIAGPPRVADEARARLEHIADTFLSVSAPVQHALPELLGASFLQRTAIRARLRNNLEVLDAALRGSAATRLFAEGGWYAVLRLPRSQSEEAWVLGLLEQARVIVEPGYFYDFESEPFVVVSLLTPERKFTEGVQRLCELVSALA